MADPYLGEIRMAGFNFAPVGWALCQGQLLSIAQNTALFSLLGTTFGGDGVTTFALPDYRSRVPIGQGQGPGLTMRVQGEVSGVETVTLNQSQTPAHSHAFMASNANPGQPAPQPPGGNVLAKPSSGVYNTTTTPSPMAANALFPSGDGQPHDNMQPTLCINFIIALEGIYPSRN